MQKDRELLVTPEEAVRLSKKTYSLDICTGTDIAKLFEKTYDKLKGERYQYFCMKLLGTVFNAGRIQGIREERLKHRKMGGDTDVKAK